MSVEGLTGGGCDSVMWLKARVGCWRRTGGEIKRERREKSRGGENREIKTQKIGSVDSKERKKIKIKTQKVFWPDYTYRPKQAETSRNGRNTPKFYPRWNRGLSCTGLHTGTRFSVLSLVICMLTLKHRNKVASDLLHVHWIGKI
jgi:hypothetical protein